MINKLKISFFIVLAISLFGVIYAHADNDESSDSSPKPTLEVSPIVTITQIPDGCAGGNKFNTITGFKCAEVEKADADKTEVDEQDSEDNAKGCSEGNKYNTETGAICVNNEVKKSEAPKGCSGENKFNTETGLVCENNLLPETPKDGCAAGNKYNSETGLACAYVAIPVSNGCLKVEGGNNNVCYKFGAYTLKNGSKGEAVTELQRYLNDTMNLGLKLDGKLGPKTVAVIRKWQKANGLKDDGLIGKETKAKMLSLIKSE